MTSSGASREWDLVVPADGRELLAELHRHGVEPGQRVHLRVVPEPAAGAMPAAADVLGPDDLRAALATAAAAKRPPFMSPAGALASRLPDLSLADFDDASSLAAADVEGQGTLSE